MSGGRHGELLPVAFVGSTSCVGRLRHASLIDATAGTVFPRFLFSLFSYAGDRLGG
jgi:hypothetical protein